MCDAPHLFVSFAAFTHFVLFTMLCICSEASSRQWHHVPEPQPRCLTLLFTPYTLHITPYTLHLTLYTLNS